MKVKNKPKVGVIYGDTKGLSLSMQRLSKAALKALKANFRLKYLCPEKFPYRIAQNRIKSFSDKVDVLFELPFKRRKYLYPRNKPLISFEYGHLTDPELHLTKMWNYLWPNNTLLCASSSDLELFRWLFPESNGLCRKVAWAVDTNVFKPCGQKDCRNYRKQLGIAKHESMLAYAGRIFKDKNIQGLIEVFEEVLAKIPQTRLVLVGFMQKEPDVDSYEYFIKDLIRAKGLEDKVLCLSVLGTGELVRLYSACDLFVNLSTFKGENFGFAQVEAMACAAPVVCSCWGGLKDTVIDSETGFLIPVKIKAERAFIDKSLAAERIIRLLNNNVLRLKFKANALSNVKTRFSGLRFSERLKGVVKEALAEKIRPDEAISSFCSVNNRLKKVYADSLILGNDGLKFVNFSNRRSLAYVRSRLLKFYS